jgi:hypothetical protein
LGSAFLSIEEAATRLGRHKRSIHNYITKGFLNRIYRDGRVLIPSEDVEQLAVELGTDFPALNRKTLFEMQSRLRKLETQMAMVQATWGAQEKPLRPNPNEAVGLMKAATDYMTVKKWRFEELNQWATLFNQIDEDVLAIVASACMTTKPWENFHQLAGRMLDYIDKSKPETLEMQALRAKMESGKKRVREAALFWLESGRGTVPVQVFKALDTPREDLLRALSRPQRAKA